MTCAFFCRLKAPAAPGSRVSMHRRILPTTVTLAWAATVCVPRPKSRPKVSDTRSSARAVTLVLSSATVTVIASGFVGGAGALVRMICSTAPVLMQRWRRRASARCRRPRRPHRLRPATESAGDKASIVDAAAD